MHVTLYSKPGCHLCDDVRALIEELRAETGLVLAEVNITSDEALYTRYRHEIPVVLVDGVEVARGKIDEQRLAGQLRTKNA